MEVNAEKLVNEVTALLMNNGCTINQPAMYELAIYIMKREKAMLETMKFMLETMKL